MGKNNYVTPINSLNKLGVSSFEERLPWLGGDLQTLRDTFIIDNLPLDEGENIKIPISSFPFHKDNSAKLLAILDYPQTTNNIKGVVLMIHGLGGSSKRTGLRRMAFCLQKSGFAILRINLRGAGEGRSLAGGTYSAKCTIDLFPAIKKAREICKSILDYQKTNEKIKVPLFGVGISLGGTILLNACLERKENLFDGLACTSSPLDLNECSLSIERNRNKIYQKWLLKRLLKQTINDPFITEANDFDLIKSKLERKEINTIRDFDQIITAPRWSYKDVEDYYHDASPINNLLKKDINLPPTLLLQALDDPWVPSISTEKLLKEDKGGSLKIIITKKGGHNGFHGRKGCWGDFLVRNWLLSLC